MAQTKDALRIIDHLTGDDRALQRMIEEETLTVQVAHMIYAARTKAGLTQKDLAERVGTKQPVIARLEDAEYAGHSLTMLQRIAAALEKRVAMRLVSAWRKLRAA